jgi:hypothetical protein
MEGFSKEYRYRLALEKIDKMLRNMQCSEPNYCMGECSACRAERAALVAQAALRGES